MSIWRTFILALCFYVRSLSAARPADNHQVVLADDDRNVKPNIIFILTDDQDARMDSLSFMPYVQKHLISRGTLFQRHYCTVALCCPSRVNLWTGKAAHNTNVTDVNPPYGK